jgi:hypothetical protein
VRQLRLAGARLQDENNRKQQTARPPIKSEMRNFKSFIGTNIKTTTKRTQDQRRLHIAGLRQKEHCSNSLLTVKATNADRHADMSQVPLTNQPIWIYIV